MAKSFDLEFRLGRAKRLERARFNKSITRSQLAEITGYDEKTIRNALSGEQVRDQTIVDISQALGLDAELYSNTENIDVADDEFGGYARSTHRNYEGFFYFYRRSFTKPGRIFRAISEILWDDQEDLFFNREYYTEQNELKYHESKVYVSTYTSLIHFVTVHEGSIRALTLTKMRDPEGVMRGCIMTQTDNVMFFQPILSPIVMRKIKDYKINKNDIALLETSENDYEFAKDQLDIAERLIIKLAFNSVLQA